MVHIQNGKKKAYRIIFMCVITCTEVDGAFENRKSCDFLPVEIIIIFINLAERHPLLDLSLPEVSPHVAVLCVSLPADLTVLHEVIGPTCGRTSNVFSFGTRSPLQNFSNPSTICSAMYGDHFNFLILWSHK